MAERASTNETERKLLALMNSDKTQTRGTVDSVLSEAPSEDADSDGKLSIHLFTEHV